MQLEEQEVATMPRIYISDVAAYNIGKLRGVWIDLFDGIQADDIEFAIKFMLRRSPCEIAEDWRLDNAENFPQGECWDLHRIAHTANLVHQYGLAAIKGYLGHLGSGDADLDLFGDYYIGFFESEADFCREHLQIDKAAAQIQVFDGCTLDEFIDWEAIANTAFINLYYSHNANGGVHVYCR